MPGKTVPNRIRSPILKTNRSEVSRVRTPQAGQELTLSNHQKAMQKEHYERRAMKGIMGKLKHEAVSRYGSLRGLFRDIDKDGGGQVCFNEFTQALERTGMHTICTPQEQKLVFDMIDEDKSGEIGYIEFQKLFDPKMMQIASRTPAADVTIDKYHPEAITPRTYYELERLKEKIVEKISLKSKLTKVAYNNNSQMLLNVFQQLDDDGDSALTYADMEHAFGPKQLDMNFSKKDLTKILLASDKNRDGFISYQEFIAFLTVHDIEPNFSPFYDGRKRQVDKLTKMKKEPRKYAYVHEDRMRRLHNHTPFERKEEEETAYPMHNIITPKNVRPRMATGELQKTDMSIFSTKMPAGGMTVSAASTITGSHTMAARSSVYDPVSTGVELLEKLHQKSEEELVVPDRFSGTMQFKGEWNTANFNNTRTGIGSGGVVESSGLYMNADDRFRTTQHTFFGSRPDQLGQDVADQSLSVQSANFRKNKTRIQRGTLNKHETWMQSNARQREDVKKMEDEARLHATSALRLKYLEKVYLDDYNRQSRLNDATGQPQRGLAGSEAEQRMWHGTNTTIPTGINMAEARFEKKFFKPTDKSWLSSR